MKKVRIVCTGFAVFALASCTENQNSATETPAPIVIEKEVSVPAPQVKNEEGTSISIDKNGVEFSKKDGNTKIDVDLKDKNGSLDIKKK